MITEFKNLTLVHAADGKRFYASPDETLNNIMSKIGDVGTDIMILRSGISYHHIVDKMKFLKIEDVNKSDTIGDLIKYFDTAPKNFFIMDMSFFYNKK